MTLSPTSLDLRFTRPRYGAASIADVMPTVCDGMGVPGGYDILGLGPARRVAVIVVDGLGARQLIRHAEEAPFLSSAVQQEITSVFPSTTPAGLTSIGTGLSPGEHGLVGAAFRIDADGRILRPLNWSHHPEPHTIQGEPTWWSRAQRRGVRVRIVSPRSYQHAGLTVSALGGATFLPGDGPGERVEMIGSALEAGSDDAGDDRRLVYGYWEWLDKTAHLQGVGSAAYRAELRAVDSLLQQVLQRVPAGCRVIVTADHGVVDCPEVIDLDSIVGIGHSVRAIAGEPRMRHIYTAPGAAAEVAQRYREALADSAEVVTRGDAVAAGWFGQVTDDHLERIGDVLLLARGTVRLAAPSVDRVVSGLLGQHGSLTAEEMFVPLAVWDT